MNRRVGVVVLGVAVLGLVAALLLSRRAPGRAVGAGAGNSAIAGGGPVAKGPGGARARGAIRGRVVDVRGPLAGASVCAATRGGVQACGRTDAQGAYAIEALGASAYRVTALATLHRPGTFGGGGGDWVVLGDGEVRGDVDVVLRAGVLLAGVVQDINGGPIAGSQVRAQTEGGFETLTDMLRFWSPPVVSGADGAFQLWVEPGRGRISAVADGYGETSVEVDAPTTVVILLTPAGAITGTVIDAAGQPVADATVEARSLEMTVETRTDAAGAFTLDHLVASRFSVTAHSARGYGAAGGRVAVWLGQQATVRIQLVAASRLSGIVMLGDAPCPAPRVDMRDLRTQRERSMVDDGGGGRVHIDGLLPGEYVAYPRCAGGYAHPAPFVRITVTEADQEGLVWHTTAGASVRGRVTNETGAPVADVTIAATGEWSEQARTGDDGRFELRGLHPGDYAVVATALDGGRAERALTLGEAEARVLDLQVQAGARIVGTIVDPAGRPVAGLEFRAELLPPARAGGRSLSAPTTSVDGAFELPVQPGAYHVFAAVDWTHPIEPGVDVTVAAGQRATVRLQVPAQDGAIQGTVVDPSGAAITDAVVTATPAGGLFDGGFTLGWNEHPVLTAADGTFALRGLGPGTYTVQAARPGTPVAIERGVALGATVTLTIATPASVTGTVTYADGTTPREFLVAVRDDAGTFYARDAFLGTRGAFHLAQVASGPLTLSVLDPDRGFLEVTLALAPGEARTDLALVLRPMVEVRGRLIDDVTKQPIAGEIVLGRSRTSVVKTGAYADDPNHLTGADGRFAFMAPTGDITVTSRRFSRQTRELCEAMLEKTIDGPTDVGTLEMGCRKL